MTATTEITSKYATPLDMARFINVEQVIPDISTVGSDRTRELVGAGTGTAVQFFLDNARVVNGSYELRYGPTESGSTALTETDDYTLNLDRGEVTITSSGTAVLGTDNLYASYSYLTRAGVTNTILQDALDRAESEVDRITNNHFANGSTATPDWEVYTEEKHRGEGLYYKDYYTDHYPIPKVSTTVSGTAVTADDTTIYADSTSGFPESGYMSIEDDKIAYTGKTDTTFTGCTDVSAHGTAVTIYPYVVEVSTTSSGTTPTWTVVSEGDGYDLDHDSGRVHLYEDSIGSLSVLDESVPPRLIPNRIRITYIMGTDTIPDAVKKAALMIASQDLMHMAARKALIDGNDNFNPRTLSVDMEDINKILEKYTNHGCSNI